MRLFFSTTFLPSFAGGTTVSAEARRVMGDLQHFCLRWNNYQNSITTAFENLRDDEDFIDVTLACDGKSLKAHRVVLSACSPYFRELLKVSFACVLRVYCNVCGDYVTFAVARQCQKFSQHLFIKPSHHPKKNVNTLPYRQG